MSTGKHKYHGVCIETVNAITKNNTNTNTNTNTANTGTSAVKGYYKYIRLYRAKTDEDYHNWAVKILGVTKSGQTSQTSQTGQSGQTGQSNKHSNSTGIRIMSRLKNTNTNATGVVEAPATTTAGTTSTTPIPALTVEFDLDLDKEPPHRSITLSKPYYGPNMVNIGSNINYLLSDPTAAVYGAMLKGLVIQFGLAIDHNIQAIVAHEIHIQQTDIVTDTGTDTGTNTTPQYGVIQSITRGSSSSRNSSSSNSGYIRVIDTDEKLFWIHTNTSSTNGSTSTSSNSNGTTPTSTSSSLSEGMLVTFRMVLLGGLRCAVEIQPSNNTNSNTNTNSMYKLVSTNDGSVAKCVGVIVNKLEPTSTSTSSRMSKSKSTPTSTSTSTQFVVLLDTSQCCDAFNAKYEDRQSCLMQALQHSITPNTTSNTTNNSNINAVTSGFGGLGLGLGLDVVNDKPKYFNSLFRQPIPLITLTEKDTGTSTGTGSSSGSTNTPTVTPNAQVIIKDICNTNTNTTTTTTTTDNMKNDQAVYVIGDMVECSVVTHATLQRSPIGVCSVHRISGNQSTDQDSKSTTTTPTGTATGGVYVNGRVVETHIRTTRTNPNASDLETPIEYIHLNIESELPNTDPIVVQHIQRNSTNLSQGLTNSTNLSQGLTNSTNLSQGLTNSTNLSQGLTNSTKPNTTNTPNIANIASSMMELESVIRKEHKKIIYSFYCDSRELLYTTTGKMNNTGSGSVSGLCSVGSGSGSGSISKGDIVRFMIIPTITTTNTTTNNNTNSNTTNTTTNSNTTNSNSNGVLGGYEHVVIGATVENRLVNRSDRDSSMSSTSGDGSIIGISGIGGMAKRKEKSSTTGSGSGSGGGNGGGGVGGVNNITMAKVNYSYICVFIYVYICVFIYINIFIYYNHNPLYTLYTHYTHTIPPIYTLYLLTIYRVLPSRWLLTGITNRIMWDSHRIGEISS